MNTNTNSIQNLIDSTQDDVYCSLLDNGLNPSEAYNLVFNSDVSWTDTMSSDFFDSLSIESL